MPREGDVRRAISVRPYRRKRSTCGIEDGHPPFPIDRAIQPPSGVERHAVRPAETIDRGLPLQLRKWRGRTAVRLAINNARQRFIIIQRIVGTEGDPIRKAQPRRQTSDNRRLARVDLKDATVIPRTGKIRPDDEPLDKLGRRHPGIGHVHHAVGTESQVIRKQERTMVIPRDGRKHLPLGRKPYERIVGSTRHPDASIAIDGEPGWAAAGTRKRHGTQSPIEARDAFPRFSHFHQEDRAIG
ncbi:hypothetical protein D9M73_177890 [compost metagenome]